MRAYNLFQSKLTDLCCAVPEDCSVPDFLTGEAWQFGGKISDAATAPAGFDPEAAARGARANGFYLFRVRR